jgi:DNA polymerase I-like protein with 3'-5' exonuclease and polymerase domains
MFKPEIVAIDYETGLVDGTPSVDYYRHDFRALTLAISYYKEGEIVSQFAIGEDNIRKILEKLSRNNIKIVVHNLQFEYGVTTYRFPDIKLNWYVDTMRLTQVGDNGGKDYVDDEQYSKLIASDEGEEIEEAPYFKGLSLQACISRWLPAKYHNHKEPFYEYIRQQGIAAGKEGQNLHLLPPDMLKQYNVADSENTLHLYKTLIDSFIKDNYNWQLDHSLYINMALRISLAKGHGIIVNRAQLLENINKVKKKIADIDETFYNKYKEQINIVEQENLTKAVFKLKTEEGQASAWERQIENLEYKFKFKSSNQKTRLFIDLLGIQATFFTKKNNPAFGKAFLSSYGEGGKMMEKRGTETFVLNQMENLYYLSEYDGKWHLDLRACGTKTGRMAGGK